MFENLINSLLFTIKEKNNFIKENENMPQKRRDNDEEREG